MQGAVVQLLQPGGIDGQPLVREEQERLPQEAFPSDGGEERFEFELARASRGCMRGIERIRACTIFSSSSASSPTSRASRVRADS